MGDDAFETEDEMVKVWRESMQDVNLRFINYEDFVLLMKGQKRDNRFLRSSMEPSLGPGLSAMPEITEEEEDDHHVAGTAHHKQEFPSLPLDEAAMKPEISPKSNEPHEFAPAKVSPNREFTRRASNSAPPTPEHLGKRYEESDQDDSPFNMDNGVPGSGDASTSFNERVAFQMPDLGNLTPPQTPVRGPSDYVTPTTVARVAKMDPELVSHLSPPDLSLPPDALRTSSISRRSSSMDAKDTLGEEVESRRSMMFKRDNRRDVPDNDGVIDDRNQTPLVVNRALYRAHREFRLAVTEACKRFEDEQVRRAKETLRAREEDASGNGVNGRHKAGLVMRHGQALSEQSIKDFLKKSMEEQQRKVDAANRRGGRGRRSRKKTLSDMSGMMGGPPAATPAPAAADRQSSAPAVAAKENENNLLRNPTKPGEFRKTNYDPFQRRITIQAKPVFENVGGRKSPSTLLKPTVGGRKSPCTVPPHPVL